MIKTNDLLKDIVAGTMDAKLNDIADAINVRRDMALLAVKYTLKVGAEVTINSKVRPTYLAGAKAIIRAIKNKRVVIDLMEQRGRFYKSVRCPISMLAV